MWGTVPQPWFQRPYLTSHPPNEPTTQSPTHLYSYLNVPNMVPFLRPCIAVEVGEFLSWCQNQIKWYLVSLWEQDTVIMIIWYDVCDIMAHTGELSCMVLLPLCYDSTLLGYEISGVINALCNTIDENRFKVGDKVIIYPEEECINEDGWV